MVDLQNLAARLDDAQRLAIATPQLESTISIAEAYEVQRSVLDRRYERGERRLGIKMGFTSRAKMVQMGVNEMIWGRLTDGMLLDDGGRLDFSRYIHPRVEPEIAFILDRDLPEMITPAGAALAVGGIAPALEIIDSRYKNFKFSVTDVVADNSSSSGFVVGSWTSPLMDLSNLGMIMSVNGVAKQIGSSAAILGNPLRSLVAAARLAARSGEPLRAGDIVLAGGATAAEALSPNDHVQLEVQGLGLVEFCVSSAGADLT